jgi:hypothetical protein
VGCLLWYLVWEGRVLGQLSLGRLSLEVLADFEGIMIVAIDGGVGRAYVLLEEGHGWLGLDLWEMEVVDPMTVIVDDVAQCVEVVNRG